MNAYSSKSTNKSSFPNSPSSFLSLAALSSFLCSFLLSTALMPCPSGATAADNKSDIIPHLRSMHDQIREIQRHYVIQDDSAIQESNRELNELLENRELLNDDNTMLLKEIAGSAEYSDELRIAASVFLGYHTQATVKENTESVIRPLTGFLAKRESMEPFDFVTGLFKLYENWSRQKLDDLSVPYLVYRFAVPSAQDSENEKAMLQEFRIAATIFAGAVGDIRAVTALKSMPEAVADHTNVFDPVGFALGLSALKSPVTRDMLFESAAVGGVESVTGIKALYALGTAKDDRIVEYAAKFFDHLETEYDSDETKHAKKAFRKPESPVTLPRSITIENLINILSRMKNDRLTQVFLRLLKSKPELISKLQDYIAYSGNFSDHKWLMNAMLESAKWESLRFMPYFIDELETTDVEYLLDALNQGSEMQKMKILQIFEQMPADLLTPQIENAAKSLAVSDQSELAAAQAVDLLLRFPETNTQAFLKKLSRSGPLEKPRALALWTLFKFADADEKIIIDAIESDNPKLRITGADTLILHSTTMDKRLTGLKGEEWKSMLKALHRMLLQETDIHIAERMLEAAWRHRPGRVFTPDFNYSEEEIEFQEQIAQRFIYPQKWPESVRLHLTTFLKLLKTEKAKSLLTQMKNSDPSEKVRDRAALLLRMWSR